MKTEHTLRFVLVTLMAVHVTASAAETFTDDFASGLDLTAWQVISNTSLYSMDTTQSDVRISKPADGSYSFKYAGLEMRPRLRGDFDVAVDFRDASINRLDGSPGNQIQLNVFLGSQAFILVRSDEASAGHNVHVWLDPPRAWFGTRATNTTTGRFRIARTGVHVRGWLDDLLLYEGDYNAADATVQFVLQNNGTRDATAVTFDNFTVIAQHILWPAHFFTETFEGPLLHPALVDRAGVYALANGEARCTSGRNYIRTVASDYNTVNFLAEVIYTMNGGGGAGGLFFGLGPADRDPAYFYEPLFSVFAIDHAQDWPDFQGTVVRAIPVSGQPQGYLIWADPGTLTDGTNALRLLKQGEQLTWQMDHHYDETTGFVPTYSGTLSLTNFPFLNASNSHLFFGTEVSPTRIREFHVLPNGGDWDAARDLALNEFPDSPRELLNPNPTVTNWSYGYRTTLLSTNLTLWSATAHTNSAYGSTHVHGWLRADGPTLAVNVSREPVVFNFGWGDLAPLLPGEMNLHPGRYGDLAVVRWTAPASAQYAVTAWWRDLDPYGGNGVTGAIVTNGAALFQQAWPNTGEGAFTNTVSLNAGDLVDFCLVPSGDWGWDTTAFNARIQTVSESPDRPRLTVTRLDNAVVLSWPASATGWVLEATNALPNVFVPWPQIPPPYQTNGANLQLIESAPVGNKFYRLHKP